MAGIERHIVDSFVTDHAGVTMWTIRTRNPSAPDAPDYCYVLPEHTFENLAVEYGLDPYDIDELLRVACLQLHIPPAQTVKNNPAALAGHVRAGRPVTLGTAASTDQARDAHLARVAWVEENLVRLIPAPPGQRSNRLAAAAAEETPDPHAKLQALKDSYRPDPARMAKRRNELRHLLGRDI